MNKVQSIYLVQDLVVYSKWLNADDSFFTVTYSIDQKIYIKIS